MNFIDLCRKTPVVINILSLKTDTNYTAWAKDSVVLYKGFLADSTGFTARVIKDQPELYLTQGNQE